MSGKEKVKLGTVAAIGFDQFDPPEWLGLLRQLGCQVVQAYRNQERDVSLKEMQDAIAAGGMPCDSLHGLFGDQYDPSCPDEQVRRSAVETFKREADICLSLGGDLVVVHCSTIRPEGITPQEHEIRINQLKKSIEELGEFGKSIGVRYAFENLPAYHAIGSDVAELARVLREVAAPNTGMCFDTGHANMTGDPVQSLLSAGDTVIYVHLSDNSTQADEHEMITLGTIDADTLARTFSKIGYEGTLMLETFYPADRLRQLLDSDIRQRLSRLLSLANGQQD